MHDFVHLLGLCERCLLLSKELIDGLAGGISFTRADYTDEGSGSSLRSAEDFEAAMRGLTMYPEVRPALFCIQPWFSAIRSREDGKTAPGIPCCNDLARYESLAACPILLKIQKVSEGFNKVQLRSGPVLLSACGSCPGSARSTRASGRAQTNHQGRMQEMRREIAAQFAERPWYTSGSTLVLSRLTAPRSVLLGDAAHAVSAAFGQGVNSALEARAPAACFSEPGDWT